MKHTIDYTFTIPFSRTTRHGSEHIGNIEMQVQLTRFLTHSLTDADGYDVHFDSVILEQKDAMENDIRTDLLPGLKFQYAIGQNEMWDYLQDYCKGICMSKWSELQEEAVQAHVDSTVDMPRFSETN